MKNNNESPSTLRIGKIIAFDPKTLRARVQFPDLGVISHWLPVILTNSAKTKDTYFLDEGEHVACLMQGTGSESGIILGAIYDDKNLPVIQDKDIRSVKFDDDTLITYDRNNHKLLIDVQGDVEIKASKHMQLTAERIDLN